jgi:hypothetical protein
MPKTKKQLFPKNLLEYEVYIEDTSANSDYFRITNLPQLFTGGRNSFLIDGSEFLRDASKIEIEIIESKGNTIYQNPVKNYVEGTSILVSVEVYSDTPTGFATLVIMGEAEYRTDAQPVPAEWQNTYNIRWTKQVMVEPGLRSRSPIKFLNFPQVGVEERRFYTVATSSYDTSSIPFTASLFPLLNSARVVGYGINAQLPTSFSGDYLNGYITGSIIIDDVSGSVELLIDDILNVSTSFAKRSLITLDNGAVVEKMLLFSGSYLTPVLTENNSIVTSSTLLQYGKLNTNATNIPVSYAKLRIFNMNTVSGEIFKVRVYNKVSTNISDYKLIADIPVTTEELIVTESIRGAVAAGNFYLSPTASLNWYADELTGSADILYPVSGSAPYYNSATTIMPFDVLVDSNVLIDSMFASVPTGSDNQFTASVSSSGYFIGTKSPITVFQTTEYTLQLDAFYKKESGSVNLIGNTPLVNIYITGVSGSTVVSKDPLGQLIGTLTVESGATVKRFQTKQFNFYPNVVTSGTVGLRFVVQNGFWNFSKVSLKPASDALFAPDEVQLLVPNTDYYNSLLQYKVEFFDINNNSADVFAESIPTFFTGSNIDLGTLP